MTPVNDLDVRTLAVLADCHIHPGGGPDWTDAALRALAGAEAIVTLGDMGESAGLDRLAAIAPVIGVRGADDADDPRTDAPLRALRLGGARIGCVFDAKAHGLATASDPFSPTAGWTDLAEGLFGGPIQALLHAGTHRPSLIELDGVLAVNPGSALLPGKDAAASFALLSVEDGRLRARIVQVAG